MRCVVFVPYFSAFQSFSSRTEKNSSINSFYNRHTSSFSWCNFHNLQSEMYLNLSQVVNVHAQHTIWWESHLCSLGSPKYNRIVRIQWNHQEFLLSALSIFFCFFPIIPIIKFKSVGTYENQRELKQEKCLVDNPEQGLLLSVYKHCQVPIVSRENSDAKIMPLL